MKKAWMAEAAALTLSAISGVVAGSFRVVAGDPHAILVGVAVGGVVLAVCLAIVWLNRWA